MCELQLPPGRRLFWLWLAMLLAFAGSWAAPAFASSGQYGTLARPCLLATTNDRNPSALLADAAQFRCSGLPADFAGPVTWGLFDQLSLETGGNEPLLFRFGRHRFSSVALWAQFENGRTVRLEQASGTWKSGMSSGIVGFHLPAGEAKVRAILIRETGLQNQRGIAPSAAIQTQTQAHAQDEFLVVIYALACGAVIALLLYNLSLYVALRYRFILAYSGETIAVLLFGACWSGAIHLVSDSITPAAQVSLTLAAVSLYAASVVWFMRAFVERDLAEKWTARVATLAVVVNCLTSAFRLFDDTIGWRTVDFIYYASLGIILLAITASAGISAFRGSKAARFYLSIWAVPIVLSFMRVLWGTGAIERGGVFTEISPLLIFVAETLLGALAVSWRIGQIRTERDTAIAREQALAILADTDSLTNILNRRALIERAQNGIAEKALILFDIDRFKAINDGHGHDVGDRVLIEVAAILRDLRPAGGHVGRIGGEEFAMITSVRDAAPIAEAVRQAVMRVTLPDLSIVTISAGIASGLLMDEHGWRHLYIAADQALYSAKHDGRNQVVQSPIAMAA